MGEFARECKVARLPVGSIDRRKKSLCKVHMDNAAGAGRKVEAFHDV